MIAGQIKGEYQTKELLLQKYYQMVKKFIASFTEFAITHIPQEQNDRAGFLSKLTSRRKSSQHRTLIQEALSSPGWDSDEVF